MSGPGTGRKLSKVSGVVEEAVELQSRTRSQIYKYLKEHQARVLD